MARGVVLSLLALALAVDCQAPRNRHGEQSSAEGGVGGSSPLAPAIRDRAFDAPPPGPLDFVVAWGPHGRLATQRGLWDLASGAVIAQFVPASRSASWCGDVLVSLGPAGLSWRDATGARLATATPLTEPEHVTCSPDGRRALAYGRGLEVWDTAHHTGRAFGGADWVGWAAWGPHDRVALGFPDALEIWHASHDQAVLERRRPGLARAISWRSDGVIAADVDAFRGVVGDFGERGIVELRPTDLAAGRWLATCTTGTLDHCATYAAAWSPGGRWIATIIDHRLAVTDVRPKRPRDARLPLDPHVLPLELSWSLDGQVLAVAARDGVWLIRMRDGAAVRLREVPIGDTISGVAEDGNNHFCGDEAAYRRVPEQERVGRFPGAPAKPPSFQPDLLSRFLGSSIR